MDANLCNVNHLDADVLLPPRKRLLAGFKRQNSDIDASAAASSHQHPPPPPPVLVVASSSSSASPPSPTPCSPSSIEFQNRLNDLLSSHFNNSQNLTPEQIVEASKSAADAAVRAAEAARAAAQEKAILVAKAVAAAKDALAVVASFQEEGAAAVAPSSKERNLKKNKLKKHVQVQLLYKKHQPVENSRDDEELARKLHRVMNSSPRISKNSSGSDWKGHKSKKLKSSPTTERTLVYVGSASFSGNLTCMSNGDAVAGELDSEGSIQEVSRADEKGLKFEKSSHVGMDNGEAESSHSKERMGGDMSSPSKKKGRQKPKKLPLSICNSRDQANPKEDLMPRGPPLTDKNMGNPTTTACPKPLFPSEPPADNNLMFEAAPIWKC